MARDLVRDLREHKKMSDADRHRAYIMAIKQARAAWAGYRCMCRYDYRRDVHGGRKGQDE